MVNPWVVRGYQFSVGVSAGVFAFVQEHGRKLIGESFRVVPYTMFCLGIYLRGLVCF